MIKTHGLTHIHLAVRDLAEETTFYERVFGMQRDTSRGDEKIVFSENAWRAGHPYATTGSDG